MLSRRITNNIRVTPFPERGRIRWHSKHCEIDSFGDFVPPWAPTKYAALSGGSRLHGFRSRWLR
ncbi:MAG TPA: hypothetical protein VNO32_06670, partial [Candidatus Acidoferrum sp.]|nr:hypothetical protein [Candidatus Acidoferrum sp.]